MPTIYPPPYPNPDEKGWYLDVFNEDKLGERGAKGAKAPNVVTLMDMPERDADGNILTDAEGNTKTKEQNFYHLAIDDPTLPKLENWENDDLRFLLPKEPPEIQTCEDKCAEAQKLRKKKCTALRKRVQVALKEAGCPSKVIPYSSTHHSTSSSSAKSSSTTSAAQRRFRRKVRK